jgi:cysteinyl-tRNA synthetase
MGLVVYNTLTRKKEEFVPIHEGRVGIYVCGPTVYGHPHIGHAKSYISFDVIVRYFRYLGYRVKYVQNITDVGHLTDDADEGEDKIIKKAREEKLDPMEVAEFYTWSYFDDMEALGVVRPNIQPRATGHIPQQIELVQTLLEKGYAYEVNGNVYFDVAKFKDYGKLSGRKLDELMAGARIEVNPEKKNPFDFALWKKAEPNHLMKWKSPWSVGYPGWHLECSAMSMTYLGETFDIHGGGIENVFPHHECEIAQSEAATGKPFVRYWLHNNMVTVDGQKMGKSLGNFITLKDAFQKYNPLTIRYFILTSHYRSPIDFSENALQAAQTGFDKLLRFFKAVAEIANAGETKEGTIQVNVESYYKRFEEVMNDDFNTPRAIALLFDMSREVNQVIQSGEYDTENIKSVHDFLQKTAGDVLGLYPESFETPTTSRKLEDDLIEILVDVRLMLKKEKNFQLADEIRDRLKELNIFLMDTPDGTKYEKK